MSTRTTGHNELRQIQSILENSRPTNWELPQELASIAFELTYLPPAEALARAKAHIDKIRQHNLAQDDQHAGALQEQARLAKRPITNAGRRGLGGYLLRQFLATLNGTPFRAMRWFELNETGLHMYQPFDTVSERTFSYTDLTSGQVVLSVNPPSYLDWILGITRQIWKSVPVLIGEIVAYEPGSGRTIATAVSVRPDRKVKEIMAALETLHHANNRYSNHQRVPRMVDLLSYYNVELEEYG